MNTQQFIEVMLTFRPSNTDNKICKQRRKQERKKKMNSFPYGFTRRTIVSRFGRCTSRSLHKQKRNKGLEKL